MCDEKMTTATCSFICLLLSCIAMAEAFDPKFLFHKGAYEMARGKAVSCGPSNFSMEWEPKDVDTRGSVKIFLDMVSSVYFDGGIGEINITIPAIKVQIFSGKSKITCDQINKIIPNSCPVAKKASLKKMYEIKDLSRAPAGTYEISVRVTNKKNELFACFKLTVTILKPGSESLSDDVIDDIHIV